MSVEWNLPRGSGEPALKVMAVMTFNSVTDVQFRWDDIENNWRVIRPLGSGRAHLEWWGENDEGKVSWSPPDGTARTEDVDQVFDLANGLDEEVIEALCKSFAISRRLTCQRAVDHAGDAVLRAQADLANAETAARCADMVRALFDQPAPVRDAGLRLAETWTGTLGELLIVIEGVIA